MNIRENEVRVTSSHANLQVTYFCFSFSASIDIFLCKAFVRLDALLANDLVAGRATGCLWRCRWDRMTTLKKNNKVRTVTVGSCDTLSKLASNCVGIECKDIIISAWFNGSPETAVGAKSGVALHAQKMMAFLQGEQVKLDRDTYFSVIVSDIKEAFLSASRVGIRKAIAGAVPKMLPIFDFKYHGRQTVMMLDDGELIVTQMTSGIIQGDELSMLFFGLYTGTILNELDGEEADGFFCR